MSGPDPRVDAASPAEDDLDAEPRTWRSLLVRLLVVALVVVCATAAGVVLVARHTTSSDDRAADGPSGDGPQPSASTVTVEAPPTPPAVLEPAAVDDVAATALRKQLAPLLASNDLGSHLGYAFATPTGKAPLLSSGPDDLVTPASTMKLLTTSTALHELGPMHRFETKVVRQPGSHRLILVGGGDPLLTDVRPPAADAEYPPSATLDDLAEMTANQLRSHAIGKVSLAFDDSLFSGPAASPSWEPDYLPEYVVSPITSLWIHEGRLADDTLVRSADPSLAAAQRFAALLRQHGVDVRGAIPRTTAPDSAVDVATIDSAPLGEIVQHTIEESDNEAAEVLLRQAAIAAGRPGSFVGGVATVRAVLGRLGVDLDGARLYDGSGLSRDDRLPVWALIQTLQAAYGPGEPDLRSVIADLPVAGFNGSLSYRFTTATQAYGLVRAKTGTLRGVHALAGIAMSSDGSPILFATVADRVPVPKTLAARAQLDRIAAAVATCC